MFARVSDKIRKFLKTYKIPQHYKIVSGWRDGEKACFWGLERLGMEIYTGIAQVGKSFNTINDFYK